MDPIRARPVGSSVTPFADPVRHVLGLPGSADPIRARRVGGQSPSYRIPVQAGGPIPE